MVKNTTDNDDDDCDDNYNIDYLVKFVLCYLIILFKNIVLTSDGSCNDNYCQTAYIDNI